MGFDGRAGALAQPSNHGPDERPSMPVLPRKCFFQFWITYSSARRVSAGVRSAWVW